MPIRNMEEAISSNDIIKIKELLSDGIDPNEKNAEGRPLIFETQNLEIIDLFLNYGLDPKITDAYGFTMEDYSDDTLLKEKLNTPLNAFIINPPKFIKYKASMKIQNKRKKTRRNQAEKS